MVTVKSSIIFNRDCHLRMAKSFKQRNCKEQEEEVLRVASSFQEQLNALSEEDLSKESGSLPVGYIPIKVKEYRQKKEKQQLEFDF